MQFYYSFMREQKQGQISCVADKDAYIQESTMDEGGKKKSRAQKEAGREHKKACYNFLWGLVSDLQTGEIWRQSVSEESNTAFNHF